jgi:hypothetical protein
MPPDPLLDLVARAAPLRDEELPADLPDALADLAHALVISDEGTLRLRPRRRLMVLALATLAVPAAGAGAWALSSHTGLFGAPGTTENDTSEWLNPAGADFPEVAASLAPRELPLPPGISWSDEVQRVVAIDRTPTPPPGDRAPALVQVTGVRAQFAFRARCAWETAWVRRREAGDLAGAGAALAVMRAAADWPLIVATDGGGVRDAFRRVNAAAARGNVGAVRHELGLNCDSVGHEGIR